MSKRIETISYVVAIAAVAAFLLGWKLLVAREQPADIAENQKRLEITAENISSPSEGPDDALRIYGVNVVLTRPYRAPFIGYGIYLGQGTVLTASHVIGRYPFAINPRVLVAGQTLPAKVIRQGSPDEIDLALLSVDEERLPISLRLRRNPFCKEPMQVGINVVVVYPERAVHSQIISPLLIAPQFRAKFGTLINEPEGSGSGVFNAEKKCFLGIMSRQITKFGYQKLAPFTVVRPNGNAGYFVPVSALTHSARGQLQF